MSLKSKQMMAKACCKAGTFAAKESSTNTKLQTFAACKKLCGRCSLQILQLYILCYYVILLTFNIVY
jgi:hypothetical protein